MRACLIRIVLVIFSVVPASLSAELQRVATEKKTIEVHATEKVTVAPEIATIKIGFQNKAPSQDTGYEKNVQASTKILQALRDAGIPSAASETQTLTLEREETPSSAKTLPTIKFAADQEWQVHIKASDAQKIMDVAVGAGANQISGVEWSVADPYALEAKAYAAAIRRADRRTKRIAGRPKAWRNTLDKQHSFQVLSQTNSKYRKRNPVVNGSNDTNDSAHTVSRKRGAASFGNDYVCN